MIETLAGGSCFLLILQPTGSRNYLMNWLLLILTLAICCFMGATPFVDNSGNTAGFVAGLLVAGGFLLLQTASPMGWVIENMENEAG